MTNKLKEVLKKAAIGKTPQELFVELIKVDCPRVALMIIDSAIKNMSLDKLEDTLLLTPEQYNIQIQNAIQALELIIN